MEASEVESEDEFTCQYEDICGGDDIYCNVCGGK
jgi:hypothetical protein